MLDHQIWTSTSDCRLDYLIVAQQDRYILIVAGAITAFLSFSCVDQATLLDAAI